MGRHRDFLQSSEIELAKDNFYTHRNRRDGRVAELTAPRKRKWKPGVCNGLLLWTMQ